MYGHFTSGQLTGFYGTSYIQVPNTVFFLIFLSWWGERDFSAGQLLKKAFCNFLCRLSGSFLKNNRSGRIEVVQTRTSRKPNKVVIDTLYIDELTKYWYRYPNEKNLCFNTLFFFTNNHQKWLIQQNIVARSTNVPVNHNLGWSHNDEKLKWTICF